MLFFLARHYVTLTNQFLKNKYAFLPKLTHFNFSSIAFAKQNQTTEYDIVILGAGIVGNAMACSLGLSPLLSKKRILILDKETPPEPLDLKESYTTPVLALAPLSTEYLNTLGVWEELCERHTKPIKKIQVWEESSTAALHLSQPGLRNEVCCTVEASHLRRVLADTASSLQPEVEVRHSAAVTSLSLPSTHKVDLDDARVQLTLANGAQLQTKLLIGADGAKSVVRQAMKSHFFTWQKHHRAMLATLTLSEPTENNVIWHKFLASGTLTLLPVDDSTFSLVWSVPPDLADSLMAMSDETFIDSLNSKLWHDDEPSPLVKLTSKAVESVLSTLNPGTFRMTQHPPGILTVVPGSRSCVPLGLGHVADYVACCTALVGDAAHQVHSLAGLGVNLGLEDAACLTRTLEASAQLGEDVGRLDPLLEYETQRQRQVIPLLAAMSALHCLGSSQNPVVAASRSATLQVLGSLLGNFLTEKLLPASSQK